MKIRNLAPLATVCLLLTGCPPQNNVLPTSTPSAISTPVPTPTPITNTSPGPLGPLQVLELPSGDLVSDSFKLEFGPGSKGIKLEFGPGTKGPDGLDFGPGTKGPRLEFGPGTKGPQNMDFNITLPEGLTSPAVEPFSVQQVSAIAPFLTELSIEFIRDNQVYATATVLPRRPLLNLDARFHPGIYSIRVIAKTGAGPLQMSWSRVEVLPDFDTELKVSVFADPTKTVKPEDLDVEILTRNQVKSDTKVTLIGGPSPSPTPIETPSPVVSPSPTPSQTPFSSFTPIPSPSSSPTDFSSPTG